MLPTTRERVEALSQYLNITSAEVRQRVENSVSLGCVGYKSGRPIVDPHHKLEEYSYWTQSYVQRGYSELKMVYLCSCGDLGELIDAQGRKDVAEERARYEHYQHVIERPIHLQLMQTIRSIELEPFRNHTPEQLHADGYGTLSECDHYATLIGAILGATGLRVEEMNADQREDVADLLKAQVFPEG
ncbi:hypothetical protein ACTXJX_17410 [Glutamicibacter ardleyensis]|uniref:hypothetical protein n=1 Tax=Glutamicibacter ardleyensis TaxID=225894 RepID=UPI003FD325B7